MKRIVLLAYILLAIFLNQSTFAEQKEGSILSVRIVPDGVRDNDKRTISLLKPSQPFYVVITNISDKPVRLWREWCSWGYNTLSFVVTDDEGKTTIVKKGLMIWDKNYPDWTILTPGDHLVFEVSFLASAGTNTPVWVNAPLPEKGKSRQITMKAVFEIPEDKETKEHHVWTGKVSSPADTYIIYR